MGTYECMLSFEHYRLHVIERWPDGAAKDAAMNAVRSAIGGLLRSVQARPPMAFRCIGCEPPRGGSSAITNLRSIGEAPGGTLLTDRLDFRPISFSCLGVLPREAEGPRTGA
jgi:hypothetical protein